MAAYQRYQKGSQGYHPPGRPLGLESTSYFKKLALRMKDVTEDGGVLKEIVRAGSGEQVPADASVLVKYSGYLEYADQPFDTNRHHRIPRLMKLGTDITLGGMEVALLTMLKGEFSRYLFKPAYAYGTLGCPPLIPPEATILFELELLDFLDTALSDDFFALSAVVREICTFVSSGVTTFLHWGPSRAVYACRKDVLGGGKEIQQSKFALEKVLKVANIEREFGNYLFRQKRFYDARNRYKRASTILERSSVDNCEHSLIENARMLVFMNLSFTYLKIERPARALLYGQKALEIEPKNAKALFRCGQACVALTEYERARNFLVGAQRLEPFNQDINNELKKLASFYRDYMEKQKDMCCRMFSSLSPPSLSQNQEHSSQ